MAPRILSSLSTAVSLLVLSAPPAAGQACPVELVKLLQGPGTGGTAGFSVEIDGTTAVVGAPTASFGPNSSGAAFLFDADTGQEVHLLQPSQPVGNGRFGQSVAVAGAYATVGTGGPDEAAYLFDVASGQELARLTPSDPSVTGFGGDVAMSGATILVGASGSAWVFDATTGLEVGRLVPDDPGAGFVTGYGSAVAVDGSRAIVGADNDGDNGFETGAAYLFDLATGQQLYKIFASDGQTFDSFGWEVAISGSRALVGAYRHQNEAGAAYLFDATTGQELFKLMASDPAPNAFFGRDVALDGDTALLGAYGAADLGSLTGAAYVFDAATGQEVQKVAPSDAQAGQRFGSGVAVRGKRLVVGASWDDDLGAFQGAAYVFGTGTPHDAYCTAKVNSLGCLPAIDSAGLAGFSEPGPFPVTAREVLNHRPGLFFYGLSGRTALPFQGGTLCALPPLQRTPVQTSGGSPVGNDCSGAYLFDFNAWIAGGTDPDLVPGACVAGQYWSRDPTHPDGTGVGLTDAVEFGLCP